jgi:hypothetical protein
MALDPRYITAVSLEPYFVDKATGAPLAGGVVTFYEDDARAVPKLVYELSGAPPNYTYTPLPNPIILSNTGTIQDAAGNNIALYYFPYDAAGNIQLYYITVTNSMGEEQFTREAWPNLATNENANLTQSNISNELTNPQFAQVLFIPTAPYVINIAGAGTSNINIAPGWFINITATGATTVTVTRNSITGVTAYPHNPPYTLTILPGANITGLTLTQRLFNNPSIWSPQAGGANGYIATSILLAPLSSVTMQYAPSVGAPQQILNANNLTGVYTEFTNTVQLTPAANTDSSNVGYVDITITLPVGIATTLSNVQVVGLETNLQNVVYEQTPVNRQIDFMFHYYNPLLQYKPIPSYLVGWDFPLNPAQFLTSTVAAFATGANTSNYVWDQTIVFQTANSGVSFSRNTTGGLRVTAGGNTQFALIQYLDAQQALKMLNGPLSVNVSALTNIVGGITGTISLWGCTDANLPAMGGNASIVATLSAAGKPATRNGTWFEITRSNLNDATFTVTPSAVVNYNNYGFSGWSITSALANTATFFAIVVGFGAMINTNTVDINSISLVPGMIPTIPAPQSADEVARECERYYNMSFPLGTLPQSALGANSGDIAFINNKLLAGGVLGSSHSILFASIMRKSPTVTLYNPNAAGAQAYNYITGASTTNTIAYNVTTKQFAVTYNADAGAVIGDHMGIHWTADARLGIVN